MAQLQRAREIVTSGEIGAVKHVEASYLQSWLVSKAWGDWRTESQWLWRLSKKHGSNGTLGDIGIHILDYPSFSLSLGEIIGVGGLLYEEKEKRFSPRFVFGYVPEQGVPGIGLMIHQEIPIGDTTLEIGTAFVFPFSGEGYWLVQGEWKHPGDHALTFAASSKNLYLGGRWLIKLPKIF